MKKIVFFPYHSDLKIIFPYINRIKSYEIIGFSSFREDSSLIHELNQLYGFVERDFDDLLSECDAVVILDNYRGYQNDKYYDVLDQALNKNVELIVSPLAAIQLDLKKYAGKYHLLENLPCQEISFSEPFESHIPDKLFSFRIPIITIFGAGRNCGKFENQLFLSSVIEEQYKAIMVSSNCLGALFDHYTMPSFLFESISFAEKIFRFNLFIYLLLENRAPDILLIEVPEGIFSSEKREFNHFSEYPLVITSAVPTDVAILNLYFSNGKINNDGLNSVIQYCENRFLIPINAICMSNIYYELPYDDDAPVVFEMLNDNYFIKNHPCFHGLTAPIYSMLDKDAAKEIVKAILKQLQENLASI